MNSVFQHLSSARHGWAHPIGVSKLNLARYADLFEYQADGIPGLLLLSRYL